MLDALIALSLAINTTKPTPSLDLNRDLELISVEQVNHLSNLITIEPKPTPVKRLSTVAKKVAKPRPGGAAPVNLDPHYETYAAAYNVPKSTLTTIAGCESRHNPNAVSPSKAYGGLYQFSASTWASTRNAMGLDPNPELRFNPEEAIKTAAFKIANGGIKAWPTCSRNV